MVETKELKYQVEGFPLVSEFLSNVEPITLKNFIEQKHLKSYNHSLEIGTQQDFNDLENLDILDLYRNNLLQTKYAMFQGKQGAFFNAKLSSGLTSFVYSTNTGASLSATAREYFNKDNFLLKLLENQLVKAEVIILQKGSIGTSQAIFLYFNANPILSKDEVNTLYESLQGNLGIEEAKEIFPPNVMTFINHDLGLIDRQEKEVAYLLNNDSLSKSLADMMATIQTLKIVGHLLENASLPSTGLEEVH